MIAKLFVRFSFLLGGLFLAGLGIFFLLPPFLIIPSQTPKADAIIDLSIDPRSQSDQFIAWLYRDKVVRNVVTVSSQVAVDVYPADYVRDHLVSLGVDRENTHSLHLPILECRAQALAEITKFIQQKGWKSVLIICQPEDSWGYERLSSGILQPAGITYAIGYAPDDEREITTDWYRSHWKVQRFVDEALNSSVDLFYSQCR